MADHKAPDYELDDQLVIEDPAQLKAIFEDTRIKIVDLLLERAATIKELSDALGRPKGTIGHHVSVLEENGLIKVVRTKMIRAIEAKYYGRTARTYVIAPATDDDESLAMAPGYFFRTALSEYEDAVRRGHHSEEQGWLSTLRYARIPDGRAVEWASRLAELAQEFTGETRGGETTYGLVLGLYPTDRPHLEDKT
ncbi:MAG: winged helix-turn-helix domain-containing protein [Acidimicrobiia bacterium]|nr:winged helix-turn-helix domain-containing protein [Acidimicrobiia bacterium]